MADVLADRNSGKGIQPERRTKNSEALGEMLKNAHLKWVADLDGRQCASPKLFPLDSWRSCWK